MRNYFERTFNVITVCESMCSADSERTHASPNQRRQFYEFEESGPSIFHRKFFMSSPF